MAEKDHDFLSLECLKGKCLGAIIFIPIGNLNERTGFVDTLHNGRIGFVAMQLVVERGPGNG